MRVVYVLGRGRSGSTVFGQALGALDGFFYAGEVRYLWDPVLTHGTRCACGAAPASCPVWAPVLARLSSVDRDAVVRWQHEVVRESRLPRLLRTRPDGWPALARYRAVMSRVYAAIADVTGCATIVDSSKRPSYALVVRGLAGCEPYFVHLVRDPRASAYSWHRDGYVGGSGAAVLPRGALSATVRWNALNLGAELVRRSGPAGRAVRVRYEDFAAAPRAVLARVAAELGGAVHPSVFAGERVVRVPDSHAIAGNPVRYRTGEVAIHDDARWLTGQRTVDRLVAGAVALPLLLRYGYPISPGSTGASAVRASAGGPPRATAAAPR